VAAAFLDHDMPDGDGPELSKWMHTINKKIPVITFSGIPYNNEHLAHLGAEYMFTKQEVFPGVTPRVNPGRLFTVVITDRSQVIGG
jgi:hypothetical protein